MVSRAPLLFFEPLSGFAVGNVMPFIRSVHTKPTVGIVGDYREDTTSAESRKVKKSGQAVRKRDCDRCYTTWGFWAKQKDL